MDDRIQIPESIPALGRTQTQRSSKSILLLLGLPIFMLGSFVAAQSSTLVHGQHVCMNAHLFDPFDPMRGSYLQITLDAPDITKFKDGDQVYTLYREDANTHLYKPISASKQHPKLATGQICLKGTIKENAIDYPFSKAFIPPNPTNVSSAVLTAELVVDQDGNAILSGINADGKKVARL
jgi:uncharacterized membrane-anchored protein